jgi:hypothetical protein
LTRAGHRGGMVYPVVAARGRGAGGTAATMAGARAAPPAGLPVAPPSRGGGGARGGPEGPVNSTRCGLSGNRFKLCLIRSKNAMKGNGEVVDDGN